MFRWKNGMSGEGLNWRMRRVLRIADEVFSAHGYDAIGTAGCEPGHGKWSWHPYGMAIDLRILHLHPGLAEQIVGELSKALGYPYQVILEDDHIHVECDLDAFPDWVGRNPMSQ